MVEHSAHCCFGKINALCGSEMLKLKFSTAGRLITRKSAAMAAWFVVIE
jgi:hypothetical protein